MSTFGFWDPCLPTRAPVAPSGPQWIQEVKHDRYRLMVRRTPEAVQIKTRRGFDWTDRFPLIVEAAERRRATSLMLDGEGVILRQETPGRCGRLRPAALARTRRRGQLLGFDLWELDGADLRREPLMHRKATLASLLRRSRDGIQLVEHFDAVDGGTVFQPGVA